MEIEIFLPPWRASALAFFCILESVEGTNPGSVDAGRPIFILGVCPRSGTNFLADVVTVHPRCRAVEWAVEDFLLHEADKLAAYVDGVYQWWGPNFDVDPKYRGAMLTALGDALVEFLASIEPPWGSSACDDAPPRRLVTKTPEVVNLDLFFDVFSNAQLLVIVRDPRAVVASGVKGLGWRYEVGMRLWAAGAATILRCTRSDDWVGRSFLLVRYEDLVTDFQREATRILGFLGLPHAEFDFDAAADLPVRGSAFDRGGHREVHWAPIDRPDGFDPLSRGSDWPEARVRRLEWLCGDLARDLGYDLSPVAGAPSRVIQRARDAAWATARPPARLLRRLRRPR